jgi:hypothetical protein
MSKYLRNDKTNRDLIAVCDAALADLHSGDNTPEVGDVVFEHATYLGWCQQHAREAVEGTAYGYEGVWPDTRCCATRTCQVLRTKGYGQYTLATAEPGDLIYWSPCGAKCGPPNDRHDAGHVGILHHKSAGGTWYVWQNTSAGGRGMCTIPLQSWQHNPVGIFRLFPLGRPTTPAGATPAMVVLNGKEIVDTAARIESGGRMTLAPAAMLKALDLADMIPALTQTGIIHANGRAYVADLKAACLARGWVLAYRERPQGPRLYPVPDSDGQDVSP